MAYDKVLTITTKLTKEIKKVSSALNHNKNIGTKKKQQMFFLVFKYKYYCDVCGTYYIVFFKTQISALSHAPVQSISTMSLGTSTN